MTNIYLDASAVAKLVIAEPESDALRGYLAGRALVSSRVVEVEVAKAVARADPALDYADTLRAIALVEFDAELARQAGQTGGAALRALDAIHVASALTLREEIEAFVTYDVRQAVAAREAGFIVLAPSPAG